eukprot:CAMPEP_0170338384 /NCGR_PEP_ID=MMETSP0116_2-20130129/70239_1 /TAXON_ID=400756 /ORGANISM="Durinskia baltica, Strain CSIRO CS-38" /LENGTH=269 /DNA_ID=CAMNT_0010591781 /DNA_START=8 /DNA_END=818 /DNA_ORIENTATION=-
MTDAQLPGQTVWNRHAVGSLEPHASPRTHIGLSARLCVFQVPIHLPWECKALGPRTKGDAKVCADGEQDCSKVQCCAQAGKQCFEKNTTFSQCKDFCQPGADLMAKIGFHGHAKLLGRKRLAQLLGSENHARKTAQIAQKRGAVQSPDISAICRASIGGSANLRAIRANRPMSAGHCGIARLSALAHRRSQTMQPEPKALLASGCRNAAPPWAKIALMLVVARKSTPNVTSRTSSGASARPNVAPTRTRMMATRLGIAQALARAVGACP